MSFDAPLKSPLQHYVDLLPRVKLIRHKQRSGLIVARMIGARLATAEVTTPPDHHWHAPVNECSCLQCFDAVGWAAGRASGL